MATLTPTKTTKWNKRRCLCRPMRRLPSITGPRNGADPEGEEGCLNRRGLVTGNARAGVRTFDQEDRANE